VPSITLALSTQDRPAPGVAAALCAVLFVMHTTAVREWIYGLQAAAGNSGRVVLADSEWVNLGGDESLTVPAGELDLAALAVIQERLARMRKDADGG
jgi:hypothetical protein